MHMAGVELVALSDAQQRKVCFDFEKNNGPGCEGLGCGFLGGAIWIDFSTSWGAI